MPITKARQLAELIANSLVDSDEISTGAVTTSKLADTLDFSSKTMVMADDQLSGDKIHGGTVSAFASTGIDDNASSTALTITSGDNVVIGSDGGFARGNLHIGASKSYSSPYNYRDDTLLTIENFTSLQPAVLGFVADYAGSNRYGNIIWHPASSQGASYFTINGDIQDVAHLVIAGDGKVGIGTTSPSAPLTVDTGAGTFEVKAKGSGSVTLASDASLTYFGSTHEFYNAAGTTTHAVIDSSGNLLVGRTSTSDTVVGAMMRPDGFIQSTRDSNIAADFNRNTLDGDIVRFSKGSAPVGSIGSYGNGANTYVNSSGTVLSLRIGGGDILTLSGANLYPTSDSGVNLGLSNRHFGNLHLSGTANVDTKIVLNNLSSDYYGTSFQINNTNADFSGALLDMRATSGSINTANGRFLRFYSDNGSTERFHVKGSGEIYTASGILLGGTGSANKLDDYEEGTFTPVLEGDSTAGDFTYNHQAGWYTKVGNLVTASINIAAYVTSGGTAPVGSLLVKGFPFTANVESVGSFQCNDMANSYQTNVAQYTAIIQSSNAHVHYRGTKNDGSAHATMQAQSMSYLRSTISYTTSS